MVHDIPPARTTCYAHLDDGHLIEATRRIGDLIEQSMGDEELGQVVHAICTERIATLELSARQAG